MVGDVRGRETRAQQPKETRAQQPKETRAQQPKRPCAQHRGRGRGEDYGYSGCQPVPWRPKSNRPGWRISARISADSTKRGPGRLKYWLPSVT